MHEPICVHKRALASGIPLGGLGTGSVEIREDGRFHDWEIFNNNLWSGNPSDEPPDMWSEDAFFAVRFKEEGKAPVVRLLYDDDKRSEAVWGRLRQKRDGRQQETGLCIKEGTLTLQQLRAEVAATVQGVSATLNGKATPTEWTQDDGRVRVCFRDRIELKPGDDVQLRFA